MDAAIEQIVRDRARRRCEYCRLSEAFSKLRFHVEHIIPRQHGGDDSIDNLALACGFCNRHKGPNLAGLDSHTHQMTGLFHPRQDEWNEHFRFQAATITGLTAIGRTTIVVLAMNHAQQLAVRQALLDEGRFQAS